MRDTNLIQTRALDHDLLRAFVAVVDYGGYTAAANELCRTQAAVSHQIKRLEDSVQATLFLHPRSAVQLTAEGEILLNYARRLMVLNDQALGSLHAGGVGGKVRLGANHFYATAILPTLLARFSRENPEILVELHTGVASDMAKRLGSVFDLAINIHADSVGGGQLIQQTAVHWVAAPHFVLHTQDAVPLALLPNGSLLRRMVLDALERSGRPFRLVYESSNVCSLQACVEAGLAMSALPAFSTGDLCVRDDEGFGRLPVVQVRLEKAERHLSRAAIRLYDFLKLELHSS
jgi:DNA-binding transcriptional LysR family regulator